ncbi:cardiolipin synthase [Alkalicoccus halolimnae]|uniref:Cardiolipin synthase n=1 Tax=Alkalicoccus halolimnae TaxID=1667239 RepID=A0A5C7FCQ5_9BACI|nr:cardiolipin synthase [Alkalicoccus halolimnae]TXF82549.1 cardiolipin synthase [Alkalicoccus halolimnae]
MEWSYVLGWSLNAIIVANFALAIFVIFIERRDAATTWAWLLVLFFLPVLGFIIYLFLGRQLKEDNFYNLSVEEQTFFNQHVDRQIEEIRHRKTGVENSFLNKYEQLLKLNLRSSQSLISLQNRTLILHDGEQKFASLLKDISNAEREINIQYYIIKRDTLGKKILESLVERARAGVKVRLLYDAVGSRTLRHKDFTELIDNNGEVRVFFPPLLGIINLRLNNRNHRKVCIIDGKIGYIGGFNVGNEYLGLDKKFGYWRDTHLRIEGDVVPDLQQRFIFDWNYAGNGRNKEDAFVFVSHQITDYAPMQIVTSGPNSHSEHLKNMMIKLIMSAEHDIYIQTPYFIPDKSFMDACRTALLSGVKMYIMIPGNPDHPFVFWASRSFLGELLQYGANVYFYEKGFLHAKTMIVDSEVSTVGTTNLDARSFKLNFEINALIYNEKIALELESLFETDTAGSFLFTKEMYAERKWTEKFKEGVSSLLSPIL